MALAGSVLGFLGDAYHIYWGFLLDAERSELLSTPLYRGHGILIAVGYAFVSFGLPWVLQATRLAVGRLARIAAPMAILGMTLVAGDYWAESVVVPGTVATQPTLADQDVSGAHLAFVIIAFALLATGWILLGVAALRSGLVTKWKPVLLIVGGVVAFTPFSGSNLLLFASVAVIAMGAWRGRRAPA